MNRIKLNIYLKNILINVFIAYFIIHPYSMVVFNYYENGLPASGGIGHNHGVHGMESMPDESSAKTELLKHLWHSFGFEMLPMAFSYVLLGAFIGAALARREYAIIEEKNKIEIINKELESLNKTKDEFLAVCSHDLKAPLGSSYLCLQLIEREPGLKPEMKEFVENGKKHLEVMKKLVNEILHLSKLESGKEVLMKTDIRVNEFMKDVYSGMKDYAQSRNIELGLHTLENDINIRADRLKLLRIINNLLTNAVKFAKSKIEFAIQKNGSEIIFSVKDDGAGISKDDHEKIFNKFEQAKARNLIDLNNQGTGLGLAIVKKLAELHGGCVILESEPGRGACFFVKLPLS
ncbi:MAG: HAMP domain-containing sensor histidine kinase [Candidatus Wallbacteria bacterium]